MLIVEMQLQRWWLREKTHLADWLQGARKHFCCIQMFQQQRTFPRAGRSCSQLGALWLLLVVSSPAPSASLLLLLFLFSD